MELNFRNLYASEIECKANIVGNKIEISLHNQAHTCTRILNEEVGVMGWEKEYTNGNKNCIVRIWDSDKNRMISKEDCGGPLTEIDGHKGQASNGFKRVCALGWGLGIELYSQPKILLAKTDDNVTYDDKGNATVSEQYSVKAIEYNDSKQITRCVIINSNGHVVYDGPNERGESNVVEEEVVEEVVIIPEDADMQNDDHDDQLDNDEFDNNDANEMNTVAYGADDELPDNTDGFDDVDECDVQPTPFGSVNYRKEFEAEINRTHAKRADVLRVLGVDSFDNLNDFDDDLLESTLSKLKAMTTHNK